MQSLYRIFEKRYKIIYWVLALSLLNLVFFHFSLFKYVVDNSNITTFNGVLFLVSLIILVLILHAFIFYVLYYINSFFAKFLLILFFFINSIAIYFVNTYGIIIDESMIGNVLNSNWDESSSFISIKLLFYVLTLGVIPSFLIIKVKTQFQDTIKMFLKKVALTFLFILFLVGINAKIFLWIDKHSKYLGGLAMPWSYVVNLSIHYKHTIEKNKKEIQLPNLTRVNKDRAIVVLVIGESARKENFSIFGYSKNTNPLLSRTENLFHFDAESCATYTTAGVNCILSHANSDEMYETLPNYLFRNGVEVIWRTTNWGEPPVHIQKYQDREILQKKVNAKSSSYDGILLAELNNEILNSSKDKILIVLHTSTSHGPSYNTKYPPEFEKFKPVCASVELGDCSQESLVNAYDNTIVYTDYLLAKVIESLKKLDEYKSTMIYVSDHGESLGENNLYMHGLPLSIAPREQYEIPFIVWVSDKNIKLKENKKLSQSHVFHSVMNFLSLQSPVYNENLNIFKP